MFLEFERYSNRNFCSVDDKAKKMSWTVKENSPLGNLESLHLRGSHEREEGLKS